MFRRPKVLFEKGRRAAQLVLGSPFLDDPIADMAQDFTFSSKLIQKNHRRLTIPDLSTHA
jgi:hypothetical protein